MSSDADNGDASARAFLRSLTAPARALGGHRELGTTALARQLGLADDRLGGHWCSRCEGIWYGCTLEVQCPRCGNRRG
jgi:hypothetical protein